MTEQAPKTFADEARETVIKSSLTGVAATVLAVTAFSPAGFGGMVGTSLASGFGLDTSGGSRENIYANLPAYPVPLSANELSNIRGELARTSASLEITRAATEAKIEHIRAISASNVSANFAPLPLTVAAAPHLPAELRTEGSASTAPAPEEVAYRDRHIELAELMFAHENM